MHDWLWYLPWLLVCWNYPSSYTLMLNWVDEYSPCEYCYRPESLQQKVALKSITHGADHRVKTLASLWKTGVWFCIVQILVRFKLNSTSMKNNRTASVLYWLLLLTMATTIGFAFVFRAQSEWVGRVGFLLASLMMGLVQFFTSSTKSAAVGVMSKKYPDHDWQTISRCRELRRISISQAITLMLAYAFGIQLAYVNQFRFPYVLVPIVLAILQGPLYFRVFKSSILRQIVDSPGA